MTDILDNSLRVNFQGEVYILNFTMRNILQYQKNTNRGVFGDIDDLYVYKFEEMVDLIACMLESQTEFEVVNGVKQNKILSDFVYGLDIQKKMLLVYELGVFALTCFSRNVFGEPEKEEKENKKKKKKKKRK